MADINVSMQISTRGGETLREIKGTSIEFFRTLRTEGEASFKALTQKSDALRASFRKLAIQSEKNRHKMRVQSETYKAALGSVSKLDGATTILTRKMMNQEAAEKAAIRTKEALQKQYQRELYVRSEAIRLMELGGKTVNLESQAYRDMVVAIRELGIEQERKMEKDRREAAAERELISMHRRRSRELMQTSISMFVMNISISQLLSSVQGLVGDNKELAKSFREIQMIMQVAIAPMQVIYALMQMQNAMMKNSVKTYFSFVAAGMMLYGMFKLLKAETIEQKIVWTGFVSIMAAAVVGMNMHRIAMLRTINAKMLDITMTWLLARAEASLAAAKAASAVAALGPWMVPVATMITVGAILAAFSTMKGAGAQTDPGEYRTVEKTGIILAHEGEKIGRVTEPSMGGEITVNINSPSFRDRASMYDMVGIVREELSEGAGF